MASWHATRGLAAFAAILAFLTLCSPAVAQISGASPSTSGSTCSAFGTLGTGPADGDCRQSVAVQTNNGTTLTTRYAFNLNADTTPFNTYNSSGTAQHHVTFTATAPAGYRLDIATSRIGDLNRISDQTACNGSADTSGVTGTSNFALASGTLSLPDPGSIPNGTTDANVVINQSGGPAVIFNQSNGVGITHNLTFTWSGSVRSDTCEVAVRQGESSGTTVGCAACGYPGSPARAQASDGHFVTVTFTSLCGNGTVDGSVAEQCDEGGANGASTSCCLTNCTFRASGVCRVSAGECDPPEQCSGSSGACPVDGKSASGTPCSSDSNPCTLDQCDGTNDACQYPAGNGGVICRSAAGLCDVAETCDGTSTACPADALASSGSGCRAAAGSCDVAEMCDGTSAACPADIVAPSGTVCRTAAGVCDVAETCDGISTACPANTVVPSGTVCRTAAGVCDAAESCDGTSGACPADSVVPFGSMCRAAAGVCDVAETCDGVSAACPMDELAAPGSGCPGGQCDGAGTCVPTPGCGNGVVEGVEECDDGPTNGTLESCCTSSCMTRSDGSFCNSDGEICTVEFCISGTCIASSSCFGDSFGTLGKDPVALKHDAADPAKDKLGWKWTETAPPNSPFPVSLFGDPVNSGVGYTLCVVSDAYGSSPTVVVRKTVPAGGTCGLSPCWTLKPGKGYDYKDKELTPDGIAGVKMRAGKKAQIKIKGNGANLGLPVLGLQPSVGVRLLSDDLVRCFEDAYPSPTKNDQTQFKAR